MVPVIDTAYAQEVAVGSSAATLSSTLDNTQAPGLRGYIVSANTDMWVAQGIADTVFTANDVSYVFTATGHKLRTGMPVQVSNNGGGLPTGLSAATTYWACTIDQNTFYLYDTQAHALAGGATGQVQVSSNGTGTQTMTTVATAAAGSAFLPAGILMVLDGAYGAKVSVIQDSASGKASVYPYGRA